MSGRLAGGRCRAAERRAAPRFKSGQLVEFRPPAAGRTGDAGAAGRVMTVVEALEPGRQGPCYAVQSIRTGERWLVGPDEIQVVSVF